MKIRDLKFKCWPCFWNNGVGLGVIVWYSGAEIVLGPIMLKLMWYDRKTGRNKDA